MPPVYSTETGRLCADCGQPVSACQCRARKAGARYEGYDDGIVRLRRETSGRKGKGVTLVDGLSGTESDLKRIAKALKARCGSGGTVKNGIIEIQGDHRDIVHKHLAEQGIKSKFAGG